MTSPGTCSWHAGEASMHYTAHWLLCRCLVEPCMEPPASAPHTSAGGGAAAAPGEAAQAANVAVRFTTPQWAPRLRVCFAGEDPSVYIQRWVGRCRGGAPTENAVRCSSPTQPSRPGLASGVVVGVQQPHVWVQSAVRICLQNALLLQLCCCPLGHSVLQPADSLWALPPVRRRGLQVR